MKFGGVSNPELINFILPADHPDNEKSFSKSNGKELQVYIGQAAWNKKDLPNFYPKGTKNELTYYSSQFNCIEMNATFYRLFPSAQFTKWKNATPDNFKFCPKIGQDISHWGRLNNVNDLVDEFVFAVSHLEDKMGIPFVQMHDNFSPRDIDRVESFLDYWPDHFPLAIEFRHQDWYQNSAIANQLFSWLEDMNRSTIIVDTPGRRDLIHMRITSRIAFIRFVCANHPCDYKRMDDWIERIQTWKAMGLEQLYFFVHQEQDETSPFMSAYFIDQLNAKLGTNLVVPKLRNELGSLFG